VTVIVDVSDVRQDKKKSKETHKKSKAILVTGHGGP
jgi:hypothetical protein